MTQETFLSPDAARCQASLSCHLQSDIRRCWYLTSVTPKIGQNEDGTLSRDSKLRETVGRVTRLSWLRPRPNGASCWIWMFLMCTHMQAVAVKHSRRQTLLLQYMYHTVIPNWRWTHSTFNIGLTAQWPSCLGLQGVRYLFWIRQFPWPAWHPALPDKIIRLPTVRLSGC